MLEPVDIYAPSAPGSLMRSYRIIRAGAFRLARRSCELYSVQIVAAGAWGRVQLEDATGELKFLQPSMFTGSFWLSGGAIGGLIARVDARDAAPNLAINWREPDQAMV